MINFCVVCVWLSSSCSSDVDKIIERMFEPDLKIVEVVVSEIGLVSTITKQLNFNVITKLISILSIYFNKCLRT